MENKIKEFCDFILDSKDIVVLTGAGISTLSGIPDFRSPNGAYSKDFENIPAEEILSLDFFYLHPEIFYRWCKDVWFNLDKYEPNVVHRALALLEKKKIVKSNFTQNIDMLNFKAGSKNVFELHGSARLNTCTKCKSEYSYEEIAPIVRSGKVPYCPNCKGLIKPNIILYGENLNQDVLTRAYKDFQSAKIVLVLGSSLIVQPASILPYLSYQNKAKIIIVNKQETYLDRFAFIRLDDLKTSFEALEKKLL